MKKILVVDDEENIRFLYKEELEDLGYQVTVAATAEEAMEKNPGRQSRYHHTGY